MCPAHNASKTIRLRQKAGGDEPRGAIDGLSAAHRDDKDTADEIRPSSAMLSRLRGDWAANGIEGLDKARSGGAEQWIVDRMLPGMTASHHRGPYGTMGCATARCWC